MRPLIIARGWIVAQDGKKFRLHKNEPTLIGEVTVTYTGLTLEVALPSGVHMVYDGLWGVQITVDEEAVTCGLCGDNNGDQSDDVIRGRYGETGGDIELFGQSWEMRGAERCGMTNTTHNYTCPEQAAVEQRCDKILQSQVFGECTTALGLHNFRESCVMDGCRTVVERFEGSSTCAVAHSLAQICQVNGFHIQEGFLEELDCGTETEFKKVVYNAGCPILGNLPYLEH